MDYTVILAVIVISYGLGYLSMYQIYLYVKKNFDKIIEAKNEHIECLTEILNARNLNACTDTYCVEESVGSGNRCNKQCAWCSNIKVTESVKPK